MTAIQPILSKGSNRCTGHFSLWGDFEIEEITNLLGIQPSQVFLKGEMIEGASSPSKSSTWDLHCPSQCESMGDQVAALLNVLWPKAEVMKLLASKFHAELNIATSCTDVLSLDHDALQKLAELNLKLNCFFDPGEDSDAH